MLLVLAQFQREHSKGKEILQGEVEEDESCWVLPPISTSRGVLGEGSAGDKPQGGGKAEFHLHDR